MKKYWMIKLTIYTLLANVIFYLGVVESHQWAINLSKFYSIFSLIIMLTMLIRSVELESKILQTYKDKKHFPLWIDVINYLYRIILFVVFGWMWIGAIWLFIFIMDNAARAKAKNKSSLLDKVVADVPSVALFNKNNEKWCTCSATELRYKLFFNHTWIEYCPKCKAQSPKK